MRIAQLKHWRGRMGLLVFASLLGMYAIPAAAQVLYGTILGTVEDATGAVVPNAKVTIAEKATGFSRETTTDVAGNYSIPSVVLHTD